MDITRDELAAQVEAFLRWWPQVWAPEDAYRLPRGLLLAVGSRETGLDFAAYGQGQEAPGGAYGIWQLQGPPTHEIPSPFPVSVQAKTASAMVCDLLGVFSGDVRRAADAYNAGPEAVTEAVTRGVDPDSVTTGGDYGTDVAERMAVIAALYPRAKADPMKSAEVTVKVSGGVGWCPFPAGVDEATLVSVIVRTSGNDPVAAFAGPERSGLVFKGPDGIYTANVWSCA